MDHYTTTSPILFLIFNRPDTTLQVFNEIKKASPPRLYIAADGPRPEKPGEAELCEHARAIVENIDWDCQVETLYQNKNVGCKQAVSSAITWFFSAEEEGVILEDDCLPSADFFRYCDVMLNRYRYDSRVRHIAGANLQLGKKWGEASYYFANQTHVWGWASWRRVWSDYDKDLSKISQQEAYANFDKVFDDPLIAEEWRHIFNRLMKGSVDTWDYQLAIINFFNNSLSVNPNVNLITNIGCRADGTHTTSSENPYANLPGETLGEIVHPKFMLPERGADYAVFERDFKLIERRRKNNLLRRRIKRWFKKQLN